MTRRVVYHALAEAELDKLYEDIAIMAGVNVAGRYIGDLIDFIEKLATFPTRHHPRKQGAWSADYRLSP